MKESEKTMAKGEKYEQFLKKFQKEYTTDDCFTHDNVMEVVENYVAEHYGKDRNSFVKPFFPGGDYQSFEYPEGCVVVDNPPFSIITEIMHFYKKKKIDFFLFCPAMTAFNSSATVDLCVICTGINLTYHNKASVATSFITNLEKGIARSDSGLYRKLYEANEQNVKKKKINKYEYPDNLVTASIMNRFSKWGIDFKLENGIKVSKLSGTDIYGGGYLVDYKMAWHIRNLKQLAEDTKRAQDENDKIKINLTQEDVDRLLSEYYNEDELLN